MPFFCSRIPSDSTLHLVVMSLQASFSFFQTLFFMILTVLFFIIFVYLVSCFWLCWVFVAARAFLQLPRVGLLSHCSAGTAHCNGSSYCGPRALGCVASLVAARGLSNCGFQTLELRLSLSVACGIFLDQGSNPCLLHWQLILTTEPSGKSSQFFKREIKGTSLAVQGLRPRASATGESRAGDLCSTLDQGTKIPHALEHNQKKRN